MDSPVLTRVELTFQLLSFLLAQIRVDIFHKKTTGIYYMETSVLFEFG